MGFQGFIGFIGFRHFMFMASGNNHICYSHIALDIGLYYTVLYHTVPQKPYSTITG